MSYLSGLVKKRIPRRIKEAARRWHRSRAFDRAIRRIQALPPDAVITRQLLEQLRYGWGNLGWSANPEFLDQVQRQIATTYGPVLECGSGLTTILLGLLIRNREIELWSLEDDPEWCERVRSVVNLHGIDNVRVCLAPLHDYGEYTWYSPPVDEMPRDVQLVICDGPAASTPGGRYGLFSVMRSHLANQYVVLVDDADREGERKMLERWEREHDGRMVVERTDHNCAVCTVSLR